MKVLITGATGFIGRNLAERLIDDGHEVICIGRSLGKLKHIAGKARIQYLDMQDYLGLRRIIRESSPDAVFHCAALIKSNVLNDLRVSNVEGTRKVLDACLREKIPKVVYLSSVAVITGNREVPFTEDMSYSTTNAYGKSKAEAERIAIDYRARGLNIAILRPSMVYGPKEPHALKTIITIIRYRLFPMIGKCSNKIHLTSIDNLVDLMVLVLFKKEAYQGCFFVADEEVLTLRELLSYIAKIIGAKEPFRLPKILLFFLKILPVIGSLTSFYTKDRIFSLTQLKEKLGYSPRVSVFEGLKKAAESYK